MSPTEFEVLSIKIDDGFHGVHARIDTFKDEFNDHRLTCRDLFNNIKVDEATRKGSEVAKAEALKSRVNWGTVKTYVAGVLLTVIAVAALKILFINFGKIAG